MRVVVAYDISDDGVRAKVAAVLSAWGVRIQKSVFTCTLDEEELVELVARVGELVDLRSDSVHVFHQCAACHAKASYVGQAEGFEVPRFWVV